MPAKFRLAASTTDSHLAREEVAVGPQARRV